MVVPADSLPMMKVIGRGLEGLERRDFAERRKDWREARARGILGKLLALGL